MYAAVVFRTNPLIAAVRRAQEEQYRPPAPGEGPRTVLPLTAYLGDKGEKIAWKTIAEFKRREPALYNRFLGEHALREMLVTVVAESEQELSFQEIAAELGERADSASEWLIAIPLANALAPEPYTTIAEGIGIGRTDPGVGRPEPEEQPGPFQMYRELGDRITHGERWLPESAPIGAVDTRRTATLFLAEPGTETYALSVARSKARLALALWCLSKPPDWRMSWPTVGDWGPRPYLSFDVVHKIKEFEQWPQRERERGRGIVEYSEYELPAERVALAAPFEILALAHERLGARAVASAAWALYVSERNPADLERTDKLLYLSAAIESICDIGADPENPDNRWGRLSERYGVWKDLTHHYSQLELKEAKRLASDIRNITAHGSDDVLVNLGYPPEATRPMPRGRTLTGEQLALARAAAVLPILGVAVRGVIEKVAEEGSEHEWSDDWFTGLFKGPGLRAAKAVHKGVASDVARPDDA